MLQQRYRFHGRNSLRRVYRQGETVRSRLFAIRHIENPRHPDSRCSVVVARKVLKAAPRRNRVRRRIYEFIRLHWGHIQPNRDFIITVYEPNVYDMPGDQLRDSLVALLKRAEIWTDTPNHKKTTS